jgi:hypothetical protein
VAGSPKKRARREAAARAAAEAQTPAYGTTPAAPVSVPEAKTGTTMRPMNDELFAEICDAVANGSSLLKISKQDGMPSRPTMERWIKQTEQRQQIYDDARKSRGDFRFEMIDAIVAKISKGELEANAGRVMIDAIRWQAARENPKLYGDKIEHTGKDGAPLFPELVITYGSSTVVNHITASENPASEGT